MAVHDHIARDKPAAARKWVAAIRRQIGTLEQHPLRAAPIPEAGHLGVAYRQLLHGRYRTIYRVEGSRVIIVRVVHGAQQLHPSGL